VDHPHQIATQQKEQCKRESSVQEDLAALDVETEIIADVAMKGQHGD